MILVIVAIGAVGDATNLCNNNSYNNEQQANCSAAGGLGEGILIFLLLFVLLFFILYIKAAMAEFAGSRSIGQKQDLGIDSFVCWNMCIGIMTLIGLIGSIASLGFGVYNIVNIVMMLGNFYLYF